MLTCEVGHGRSVCAVGPWNRLGHKIILIVVVGLTLSSPSRLAAQDGLWLGKTVVQKYETFRLWKANRIVGPDGIHIYRVKEVAGSQLFLEGANISDVLPGGWTEADHVVLVDHAIEFFTDFIRSRPRDHWGYTMRAVVWTEEKETDLALEDYNEAIKLYGRSSFAFNNRGNLWVLKKEYSKAIADFDEAIRLDKTNINALCDRAILRSEMKKYANAISDLDSAIRIDSQNVFAFTVRGSTYYKNKEYAKAIADFNKAIRLNPRNRAAYGFRAWIWATCSDVKYRDGEKAVLSATKACELSEWNDAAHLNCLAAAYAETGDFDAAVKWQTEANARFSKPGDKLLVKDRLKLYRDRKPYHGEP
jgi:Flp pilus assembly protein TadD